ncbi:MAG: FAD-dependent oxidoreductase, partial [Burkholderiales bacterium]|nr:FAD-dependent oxidoreductase [Burkholderiales bacterium]
MKPTQLVLILTVLAGVVAFFALDLGVYFSLAFVKDSQAQLAAMYGQRPLSVTLVFFAVYVLITALSLPGAAIMTLAAGAIFGLVWGTVVVSFASTLGATLAMLAARYVLQDSIQARFGRKLADVNKGIDKEGAFYLFTLRLLPVIPFFALNLLMGLTRMKTWTFFWVSQVGMFAGTVAYVNAGTQLAKIDSLRGILSPALLGSFVTLGLLPLLIKKLLDMAKRRQVYARWASERPKQFDRNLIVIGGGAGGLVSAYIAAAVKAKVTLIEAHKMGGDCLNYGCVPSKALIKSAKLAHQMRHAGRYGLQAPTGDAAHAAPNTANTADTATGFAPAFSFKAVMARVHAVIKAIEPHDSIERYSGLGVEVLQGYAKLVNPWTVDITLNPGAPGPDGSPTPPAAAGPDGVPAATGGAAPRVVRLTARSIVIAAGARPFVPPLPGLDDVGYLTSDTLWDALAQRDDAPKRLVVLGGGPIGCELAQSFARLGSQVTQVEMAPRILIREDEDVSELAHASLVADGVQVLTGHKALRCERTNTQAGVTKTLVVEHNGVEQLIEFDDLLCAVGRVARLQGYGLAELGIPTNKTVDTNDYLQTLYPNIYAAGDVAGPYQFTHTAAHQAWYAAVNALFG